MKCPRCGGRLMLLDPHEPLRCINCAYVDYTDLETAREFAQPGETDRRRRAPTRQGMKL